MDGEKTPVAPILSVAAVVLRKSCDWWADLYSFAAVESRWFFLIWPRYYVLLMVVPYPDDPKHRCYLELLEG